MKVLFISSWYPNKLEPTNGNFVQRHAEAVALQHHVEVLHAIGDPNQKEKFLFDEKVINGLKTLIVYYRNTKNPLINFRRRMKAYKLGFQNMQKPDIVHANVMHNNMLFAVHLKKKYKIPYVVTEHWTALRSINYKETSSIIKYIAKYIGNHSSFILPVSGDLKESLTNLGISTPKQVIPNVVDTQLFSPKHNLKDDFVFVHISNLIPRKNPEKILNVAIKLIKDGYPIQLKIGGDGDSSQLNKKVISEQLSQKIEILPTMRIEEVAEKISSSDCFILFSNDENQPCVIAETFATGNKVISTKVGGIAEFFPEYAGILLPDVNEDLLERAMLDILKNKEWNKDIISQYAIDSFSRNRIAYQFSTIYDYVLAIK